MKNKFLFFVFLTTVIAAALFYFFTQNSSELTVQKQDGPPMGWNGWNKFRCDNANEKLILETADAMIDSGMKDAGYEYVVIDDCWQSGRDDQGNIIVDEKRFPNVMKYVADYIHDKGLKFGIYTSAGTLTCEKKEGSQNHEQQDIDQYVSWGVDYLKLDWCHVYYADPKNHTRSWYEMILDADRPIFLSISEFGIDRPWRWQPQSGDSWRITYDVEDSWESIKRLVNKNKLIIQYSGKNRWNDMDMLQVGNGKMSVEEYKSHFSMWALMGSPLMAGNDIRTMREEYKNILTNKNIIAINKDPANNTPRIIEDNSDYQIWAKELNKKGSTAVSLLNISDTEQTISLDFSDLGFFRIVQIKDLWNTDETHIYRDKYEATISPHGIAVLEVRGIKINSGKKIAEVDTVETGYLTDQEWVYASNGLGSVKRTTGDFLEKKLSVHAVSDIKYNLNGECDFFEAEISVADFVVDPEVKLFFQVFTDGNKIYDSYLMGIEDKPRSIKLIILGKKELNLFVYSNPIGDLRNRYATWMNPRVTCK